MTWKLLGIASDKDELPAPLEQDAPFRYGGPDGKARLWNPDWEVQVTAKLNREFLQEVVSKTRSWLQLLGSASLVPAESLNPVFAHSIAKGYWRHLSGVYVAQTSDAAAEKRDGRKTANKRRARRHTVCAPSQSGPAVRCPVWSIQQHIARRLRPWRAAGHKIWEGRMGALSSVPQFTTAWRPCA